MGFFDSVPGLDGYQKQVQLNQKQTDENFSNFGNAAKMMEYTRSLGQQQQQREMAMKILPTLSPYAQQVYQMTGDPMKALEAHQEQQFQNNIEKALNGGGNSAPYGGGYSPSVSQAFGVPAGQDKPAAPNALQLALLGAGPSKNAGKALDIAKIVQASQKPDATLDSALALERGKKAIDVPYMPPVSMPTSGGQTASIFPSEFPIIQGGGVPTRLGGSPIVAPVVSTPTAQTPTPADFPRVSPKQQAAADDVRANTLAGEIANYQKIINDKTALPADRQKAKENMAGVQAELAKMDANQRGVGKHVQAGIGTIGLSQSQDDQITQQRQTAAGKAVDEAFAKDYVAFKANGGGSDAVKQLQQLQDVKQALADPKANLTGPTLGKVPDAIKSYTNPQAIAMQERVAEVVQRSLRAILGAQFTENEGVRLIARAYNPNLPESENAVRVGRLYDQLASALKEKESAASFYEKNGTLQGWTGKLYNVNDFDPSAQVSSGKVSTPSSIFKGSAPQPDAGGFKILGVR